MRDGTRRIVVARASRTGGESIVFTREAGNGPGVYPSLAASGQSIIIASSTPAASGSTIRVERLRVNDRR